MRVENFLNQPIQEFINQFLETTPDTMAYRDEALKQMRFVRDHLTHLVNGKRTFEEAKTVTTVISTHRSKSITLPVYRLSRPDLGLDIYLRDNFHNWKMSVVSERRLVFNLSGLCYTTSPVDPDYTGNPLAPIYFEGFPSELIFGYYDESDLRKFSAEIETDYLMWTVMFNLMFSLGEIQRRKWPQRKILE